MRKQRDYFQTNKLPIELFYQIAKEEQIIKSREGDVVVKKGDAIQEKKYETNKNDIERSR